MKQIITSSEQLSSITGNKVIGSPVIRNSKIVFSGEGNILYCEESVCLKFSTINFAGNNAIAILGSSKYDYTINSLVDSNCSLIIGRDCFFNNKTFNMQASERCSVIIGDNCLLSFGIWLRTADPHPIYDAVSHNRINHSKDIIIGDHVWIGQNSTILKGTIIGSGSIIGAMSLVTGKSIPSNEVWGGIPAKHIRSNIFWEHPSVHGWTPDKSYARKEHHDFIFYHDEYTITKSFICQNTLSSEEKLSYYLSVGYDNRQHNRLFVDKNE